MSDFMNVWAMMWMAGVAPYSKVGVAFAMASLAVASAVAAHIIALLRPSSIPSVALSLGPEGFCTAEY